MQTPYPLVSISGTPKERGAAYGQAVPERIKRCVNYYRTELEEIGLPAETQRNLIVEFGEQIEKFCPDHTIEMQAIADACGASLEDIVLINARTEIIAKARILVNDHIKDTCDGECTGILVLPSRSQSGRLLQAQNWDWLTDAQDSTIVLRVLNDDGPSFLTLVEAGCLARNGINSAGIALNGNYLSCDLDYTQTGVPLTSLRRRALEQEHLALAMRLLAATPKACSNNVIISQNGWGMDFECAPGESFPLMPENGILTHSNHFLSPIALSKVKEVGLKNSADTYYRAWRTRALLEECGEQISVDDIKRVLADDWGKPYSICRPPLSTLSGTNTCTLATMIMDTQHCALEIAAMPSEGQSFVRYELTGQSVSADNPSASMHDPAPADGQAPARRA